MVEGEVAAVAVQAAEEVAVVVPAVAGAAGIVNSSRSTGCQELAPRFLFCEVVASPAS